MGRTHAQDVADRVDEVGAVQGVEVEVRHTLAPQGCNLLGGDPNSGVLAVGALPRPGQTIQFQRRDAQAANEDMAELLDRAARELQGRTLYGACLCSCNGRGQSFFKQPNHDAELIQKKLGPTGLAGFFCNGEIGPIGQKSFLHGYTASVALFVKK